MILMAAVNKYVGFDILMAMTVKNTVFLGRNAM
jgi:hypothetical protein